MDILGWINGKIMDCWKLSSLYNLGWQDFYATLPNLFLFIKANMGHSIQIILYCTGFEIMDNHFWQEEIMSCAILVKQLNFFVSLQEKE